MRNNSFNIPQDKKTLFIAAIMLCLKEDKEFIKHHELEDAKGFTVA